MSESNTYLILLRGINVGGKNKIPMVKLKAFLEELGCTDIVTYIQSGNAIVRSNLGATLLTQRIEDDLPKKFKLDSSVIKVLVITKDILTHIVNDRPKGFGDHPDIYHSDVIFLMGMTVEQALPAFNPREGVDVIYPGYEVIYSQRLSVQRTKSRLSKIMGTPAYQNMTIRNWNTTTKLLTMLEEAEK